MQDNKNVKEMSVIELKAIGYDLVAQFENLQKNLKIINDELASRSTPAVEKVDVELEKVEEKKEE